MERPILFSAPMVRAILERRKTQTRRIVKPQPELCHGCQSCEFRCDHFISHVKPAFKKGDILWVRETWREASSDTHECFAYRADDKYKCGKSAPTDYSPKWKPSIFMPKKACRLFLEITKASIQRLQDISEEDAIAEGIKYFDFSPNNKYGWNWHWENPQSYEECFSSPVNAFGGLWESINGANSWENNPWVWIIKFEVKNENSIL